jgi:hypothetical protein
MSSSYKREMTVKDVIVAIGKGELKIRDLAKEFGKSDRTIQAKIKALGYKWNPKNAVYEAVGEAYSPENDSKIFADLFDVSPLKKALQASQEVAVAKESNKKSKASHKQNNNATTVIHETPQDAIDYILFGSRKVNRVQRAYYIDKDLADIIDKIEGKQKSNLVNECIRKVFQEKGIL